MIGASDFFCDGKRSSQIPQEAVIGISYVVAAAAAVLLLSRAAEGDEEIKNMLVGNILLVTPREVWKRFALFVAVGVFHFVFRRNFLLVSFDRDCAYQKGLQVRWWDFFFYAIFGLVVTSFVRIAGVLLVFSYLIVPAVCGINLAPRICKPLAHRLVHRASRRRRRIVSFLLVGLAVRCSDRLHFRCDTDHHFDRRAVASPRQAVVAGGRPRSNKIAAGTPAAAEKDSVGLRLNFLVRERQCSGTLAY